MCQIMKHFGHICMMVSRPHKLYCHHTYIVVTYYYNPVFQQTLQIMTNDNN